MSEPGTTHEPRKLGCKALVASWSARGISLGMLALAGGLGLASIGVFRHVDTRNRNRRLTQETLQEFEHHVIGCKARFFSALSDGDCQLQLWRAVLPRGGPAAATHPPPDERALGQVQRFFSKFSSFSPVIDAWGNAIYYRCPGPIHKNGFDLISCGPNGVYEEGGGDDIVVGEDLPGGIAAIESAGR